MGRAWWWWVGLADLAGGARETSQRPPRPADSDGSAAGLPEAGLLRVWVWAGQVDVARAVSEALAALVGREPDFLPRLAAGVPPAHQPLLQALLPPAAA
jgi:hypothetical protein